MAKTFFLEAEVLFSIFFISVLIKCYYFYQEKLEKELNKLEEKFKKQDDFISILKEEKKTFLKENKLLRREVK